MKPLKKIDLQELLKRQSMLDEKFKEKMNIESLNPNLIKVAYLDEVGELIHELKPIWCYWKKNNKEVNKRRVLEELSDCLHFSLSYDNTKDTKLLGVFINTHPENMITLLDKLKNIQTSISTIVEILEVLEIPIGEFLEVHHQVWLRNMNIRTGDDY